MRMTSLSIIVSFLICIIIVAVLSACTGGSYPNQVPGTSAVTAIPTARVISRPPEQPREVQNPQPTAIAPADYTVQSPDVPIADTPDNNSVQAAEPPAVSNDPVPTAQIVGRPTEQPREVIIPTPAAGTSEQPEQS